MFKKSDKTTRKNSKKFGITLISEDSSFRGDISFQGGLEVQGSVKGQLVSEEPTAKVRVLNGGSVTGQISVPNVVINGLVKGDVFAFSSVKLESAAIVEGNIYYNNLEVEKGATVSGSLVREAPTSNVSSISLSEKSVLDGASKSIPGKK